MIVEEGKYYRTRDGQKVGPMRKDASGRTGYPFDVDHWIYKVPHPYGGWLWSPNGKAHDGKRGDLIAEWTDEPDLTAITTPFCLLDEATQAALKAHHSAGGEVEFLDSSGEWFVAAQEPGYLCASVYRVKPAPPKPIPLADRLQRIIMDGMATPNNEGATALAALDAWAAERGITINTKED